MSTITVFPGSADGVIAAPPSLGEAVRALVLAALTRRSVHGAGKSEAIRSMLGALEAAGAAYRREGGTIVFIRPPGADAGTVCRPLDTVCAMTLGMCAALGFHTAFSLQASDIGRATDALEHVGAVYTENGGTLTINGPTDKEIQISGDKPNGFADGLLLALPFVPGMRITAAGVGLRDSLALTGGVLRQFGIAIGGYPHYALVQGHNPPPGYVYRVGGDYGIAAHYLAAGLLSGNVGVSGLLDDSAQPEKRFVDALGDRGVGITRMNGAVFAKRRRVTGFDTDARAYEVPVLAALLATAHGTSVIHVLGTRDDVNDSTEVHLGGGPVKSPQKSSLFGDPGLNETVRAFSAIGADIVLRGGDVVIQGRGRLFGGSASSFGSAHIAMALAAAAADCETPVTIADTDAVSLVCPDYFVRLARLGIPVQ